MFFELVLVIICKINLVTVVQLISQLRGYFYVNPVLALSLAITIFSFVGVNENAHNHNNRLIPKIPVDLIKIYREL